MTRRSVNPTLTANRRRDPVGNDQYAAFTRRILAGYSRRVADGDIEALTAMAALAEDLDDDLAAAVVGLRGFGYSWTEIAARLGVTRQAAQKRWGGTRR